MTGLTFLPLAPWPLLAVLAGVGLLLVWWPQPAGGRAESVVSHGRRTAMVLLLLVAALRPGLPGQDVRVDPSAVDVYFVVDTTTSVMARDYGASQPRLEGVRADIKGVAAQLPGARYTVLTFDHDTRTRLPLTSDSLALEAAADTLTPETSVWSQGSSVTAASAELERVLARGKQTHPERARIVFYLGDGEQTADTDPQPFAIDAGMVNGGAVLGYGTAAGGQMQRTGDQENGDVVDPSTGQPAVSTIDEKQLQTIAAQLDVPYLHRTQDDQAAGIVDAVKLRDLDTVASEAGTSEVVGGRAELYWVALLTLALVAAWELGAALLGVTGPRRPRRAIATGSVGAASGGRSGAGTAAAGTAGSAGTSGSATRGWLRRPSRDPKAVTGAVPSVGTMPTMPTMPIDPRDLTPTGGRAR